MTPTAAPVGENCIACSNGVLRPAWAFWFLGIIDEFDAEFLERRVLIGESETFSPRKRLWCASPVPARAFCLTSERSRSNLFVADVWDRDGDPANTSRPSRGNHKRVCTTPAITTPGNAADWKKIRPVRCRAREHNHGRGCTDGFLIKDKSSRTRAPPSNRDDVRTTVRMTVRPDGPESRRSTEVRMNPRIDARPPGDFVAGAGVMKPTRRGPSNRRSKSIGSMQFESVCTAVVESSF